MTNREWLESLSDVALAKMLCESMCNVFCKNEGIGACVHGYECEKRALLWLQQEMNKNNNVAAFKKEAASVNFEGDPEEKEVPEGRGANVANDDLISRVALFKSWDGLSDEIKEPDLLIDEMIKRTQDAPAVDAEPVRHGQWDSEVVKCRDWKGMLRDYFQPNSCSLCHKPDPNQGKSNFCPNCGAKMDAEDER